MCVITQCILNCVHVHTCTVSTITVILFAHTTQGSGLYHFEFELQSNESFCDLDYHLMVSPLSCTTCRATQLQIQREFFGFTSLLRSRMTTTVTMYSTECTMTNSTPAVRQPPLQYPGSAPLQQEINCKLLTHVPLFYTTQVFVTKQPMSRFAEFFVNILSTVVCGISLLCTYLCYKRFHRHLHHHHHTH